MSLRSDDETETGSVDRLRSRFPLFAELIAFEDREELLGFRFGFQEMLIWPFARWRTLLSAIELGMGFQQGHADGESSTLMQTLEFALKVWQHRPLREIRQFDVLAFGSSAGVVIRREGGWSGRVNDYLVNELPQRTLLIEDSYRRKFKYPRCVQHLRFHDFFRVRAIVGSWLSPRPSPTDRAGVRGLVEYLEGHFPIRLGGEFYRILEANLLGVATRLRHYHECYSELFERTRPRVLLLEDASYGHQSYILKWARDRGIRTAEIQHGAIQFTHPAYHYGRAGFSPLYAPYLPDYLLTHGSFWSRNTHTPSKKVILGNPHFSARLEQHVEGRGLRTGNRLLIVSQGDVTSRLVRLTMDLARLAGGLEIVYRLHPGEVPFVERYEPLMNLKNVTISSSGDIYDLIAACDWVVGTSSTAIYEAIGFGKPVFVYDTESARFYTPTEFGTWFDSAEGLLSLIRDPPVPPRVFMDEVWAHGWRENYREFLEKEIAVSFE